jgi:hypothetical protein
VALVGLALIAAGVLVAAGVAKAWRPDDTARALARRGPEGRAAQGSSWRQWRRAVRAGALVEALVGLAALAAPGPVTVGLVALSYVAFSVVVLSALRRGGSLSSCGCFGRPDTPPTGVHLGLNLVLAGTSAAYALSVVGSRTLLAVLDRQPWSGVPLLGTVLAGVALSVLALSTLGQLVAAQRLVRTQPAAHAGPEPV